MLRRLKNSISQLIKLKNKMIKQQRIFENCGTIKKHTSKPNTVRGST